MVRLNREHETDRNPQSRRDQLEQAPRSFGVRPFTDERCEMPSEARISFDEKTKDIDKLLEIHSIIGGCRKGRRQLEVLNKSAIVLITAFWEAYCEDVARQGLVHIADNLESSEDLPTEMKKRVVRELKKCKHELAVWQISDSKWRDYLKHSVSRIDRMNTPKTDQVNDLFFDLIGISNVSDSWYWPGMSSENAKRKLDGFVTLRGSIAHRGESGNYVQKGEVEDYVNFVRKLAAKTGGRVNSHVRELTGKRLWTRK